MSVWLISVRKIYCLGDGSYDPNWSCSKNEALQKQIIKQTNRQKTEQKKNACLNGIRFHGIRDTSVVQVEWDILPAATTTAFPPDVFTKKGRIQ